MNPDTPTPSPAPPTVESVAAALQQVQARLNEANEKIAGHQNELHIAASKVTNLESQLAIAQRALNDRQSLGTPKTNKPSPFTGKGSVRSWCVQMDNYLQGTEGTTAMSIALSYLSNGAHEWWMVHQKTEDGRVIHTWADLKIALVKRFETLNKEKIARDKLAKWRQAKDVPTFNDDFQKILLDIPNISNEEKIDRYTRGLKSYIWKELCTKEYTDLADAMRDAERVESAHKRVGSFRNGSSRSIPRQSPATTESGPVPMDIGNIELKKLTKEERDRCMKEGLCLRCRQKGHLAKDCPKGRRN